MKRIVTSVSIAACLFASSTSYAGWGHINKPIEVAAPTGAPEVSVDLEGNVLIKNTSSDRAISEIELLTKARTYLVSKHGEEASNWPISIDPRDGSFSFYNESKKLQTYRFSE